MSWLGRLSLAQAVRWALLWPALVVVLVVGVALVVLLTRWPGDWALALNLQTAGLIPVWLRLTITIFVVLFGPSLAFLALWKLAQR
jgi:hypothetical protein